MDSAMATMIVNKLRCQLNIGLPLNTCHTHIDLVFLAKAIHKNFGLEESASLPSTKLARATRSELKADIVIISQAICLPEDINNSEILWKALIDRRDDAMPVARFQKLDGIARVSTDPLTLKNLFLPRRTLKHAITTLHIIYSID